MPSSLPTPLMLGVATLAHAFVTIPQDEAPLSQQLHTPPLPVTHVLVGYWWQNTRLCPVCTVITATQTTSCRTKPLLGAGVGRAPRLDAPLVSPHDHTPDHALTPVVRPHTGQRRLSGLTELGVRLRLARLAPRPHAHIAPFRGPACSLNRRSPGRRADGTARGTRAATARVAPGS